VHMPLFGGVHISCTRRDEQHLDTYAITLADRGASWVPRVISYARLAKEAAPIHLGLLSHSVSRLVINRDVADVRCTLADAGGARHRHLSSIDELAVNCCCCREHGS